MDSLSLQSSPKQSTRGNLHEHENQGEPKDQDPEDQVSDQMEVKRFIKTVEEPK